MIDLDYSGIELRLKKINELTEVFDPVRKKWLVLTPEEHVRQYLLHFLVNKLGYPKGMIAVEKKIMVGGRPKRFDIVVYDRDHIPWMLIECKAPDVLITEAALHQLLNYQRTVQCRYWILCNGHQTYCACAQDVQDIRWTDALPAYER